MKNFSLLNLIILVLSLSPLIAYAGTGHDHGHSHEPISATEAETRAAKRVQQMAIAGKIDSTWSGSKATKVYQKDYGHGPEWVIEFTNNKVSDKSKQTLYLFYGQDGHYIAANYDGS